MTEQQTVCDILNACRCNDIEYIRSLCENPSFNKNIIKTPIILEELCRSNNISLIIYLTILMDVKLNHFTINTNCLTIICSLGHIEILKYFHESLKLNKNHINDDIYNEALLNNRHVITSYLTKKIGYTCKNKVYVPANMIDGDECVIKEKTQIINKILSCCVDNDLDTIKKMVDENKLSKKTLCGYVYIGNTIYTKVNILQAIVENNRIDILLYYLNIMEINRNNFDHAHIDSAINYARSNNLQDMSLIIENKLMKENYNLFV